MNNDISVSLINPNNKIDCIKVKYDTPIYEITDKFNFPSEKIYAARVNNEIKSLDSRIKYKCTIEPVLSNTKSGALVYRRSLCLLLAAASHNIFPDRRLLVGHSLGYGYYYTFENEIETRFTQTVNFISKKSRQF